MPEFHMLLGLKIIKISECLCCLPDKVSIFLNLTRFMPENVRILRNKCLQKYFFTNFLGYVPPSPTPMLTGNINDIKLPKKGSHDKQKLNKLAVCKL